MNDNVWIAIVSGIFTIANAFLMLNIKLAISQLRTEIFEKQQEKIEELKRWAESHFAVRQN
jgi:hypothetical protein